MKNNTNIFRPLAVFFILIATAAVALGTGKYDVSPVEVFRAFWAGIFSLDEPCGIPSIHLTVIWMLRLPRILMALIVGAALSAAGAVFQGCFRNPLVEPYILGVSAGAAFGAALGMLFPYFFSVQLFSFVFGIVAVAFTYGFGRIRGETPMITLILAGVITGSLFSAMVSILKYMAQDAALRGIVFWLMGGFYFATWTDIGWLLPVIGGCLLIMGKLGWQLNILSLGDAEARSLGVNPEACRIVLIILATLAAAAAVSAVGIIAWVGLMMPHAARMLVGPDHRRVLPTAAAMGGIFLIICDTLARTLITAEIPIGIITSIAGAPYLFYLLRTKTQTSLV
ncbi:MAG: iron ABC transporter permease [Desulfobacterales bacterium]|nr:iron ABC transporter permease [Desulfobacterales bacterium]